MTNAKVSYADLLHTKLALLEQIYENSINQQKVIDKKDEQQLLDFLKTRSEMMDQIDRIDRVINQNATITKQGADTELLKEKIKEKLEKIIKLNSENKIQLEKSMDNIQKSIQHVQLGKKALHDGYEKREYQLFGYYVDRKVGI